MRSLIAASILSLSLAAPALAFGERTVVFDPAAELQRATGSAQYPEGLGGIHQLARPVAPGSQAAPQAHGGVPQTGSDMIVGGSSRFPVLTQDMENHLPTALHDDQALVHDFDAETNTRTVNRAVPQSVAGEIQNEVDG